jgi:predicted anti-sigma-YlaC factor YlaD
MLSCEVVTDLMSAYNSGEASAETKRLVEEHLGRCPACREAFGKTTGLDEALQTVGEPVSPPSNGTRFLLRTRKRLFVLVNGLLLLGMCGLAILVGWGMRSLLGEAFPLLPGPGSAWLALSVGLLLLHSLLLRWRMNRRPGDAGGEMLLSGAVSLPLVTLAVLACDLLVSQNIFIGLAAALILTAGVAATYVSLARLPYATVMTAAGFVLVICLLISVTSASLMAGLGGFGPGQDLSFRRPPRSVTPAQFVQADLSSLGLTFQGSVPVEQLGSLWLDSGETAAQARYGGAESGAYLTSLECRGSERAKELFQRWRKDINGGIHIMQVQESLPISIGGGLFIRTYSAMWKRTYIGWQNESWITIIEVPGSLGSSGVLARNIKDAVTGRYVTIER